MRLGGEDYTREMANGCKGGAGAADLRAQMKLAARFDDAHTKLDRADRDVEVMKGDLAEMKADLAGVKVEVRADLAGVRERQIAMDGKLDLIPARLVDR